MRFFKLEELRNEAYGNVKIKKNRVKVFHDKHIMRKTFISGQKVLLYDFRFHLFSGKLKSRWTGPFVVRTMFPHGVVEICDTKNSNKFKVNDQHLKSILKSASEEETTMGLLGPMYR